MKPFRFGSLRFRLILLVAAAVLPSGLMVVAMGLQDYRIAGAKIQPGHPGLKR